MSKETTETVQVLKIDHFSLTINIQGVDAAGQFIQLHDSASVNLNDDNQMNQVLTEKPYLKEILPVAVKHLRKVYDPEQAEARKMKEDLKSILK